MSENLNNQNEEKKSRRTIIIAVIIAVIAIVAVVIALSIGVGNKDGGESIDSISNGTTTTTSTTTTTTTPNSDGQTPDNTTTTSPDDIKSQLMGKLTTVTTVTTPTTTPVNSLPTQITLDPVNLEIEGVNGFGEFPSGSGISAVATVLQYYGIDASIVDLYNIADKYVDLLIIDGFTPSPWEKIVFDPQNIGSVYYAPPIVNMANKYLTSIGSERRAKDVSGTTLEELLKYVEKGIPVIIWATETERTAEDGTTWIADNGEKVVCKNGMEVFVIKGYTSDKIKLMYHANNLIVEYSHDLVNEMYQSVYAQAIVIE